MSAQGIFYVFLYVSDLDRSKAFYKDVMGWTLNTDTPEVGGFAFGNSYLVIRGDDRDAADRRFAGGQHVAVMVDDVDAEHRRLLAAGAQVGDVADQPWGERNFSLSDPDGYEWVIAQPVGG